MMDKLIAELEAATEGSRQLDFAIYLALGLPITNKANLTSRMIAVHLENVSPRYTTSLDAALTLVPEGWRWEAADYGGGDQDGPRAELWHGVHHYGAFGGTPVLAVCIAALRARQAMEGS